MQHHTAKHFALQLGALASLYLSLAFFLVLVFGMISLIFPDTLDSYWQVESAASSVRFGFAMTIVFFPAYLWLTRVVNRHRRDGGGGAYLGLTKWLIYLSLLVGGAVLLGDLVAIIMGFLEGELTERFMLKALAVLVVTGAAFFYYIKDAQGYWVTHEKQSMIYGGAAAVLIFATLAASLMYIETPQEVRDRQADQQQVDDLRDWQWQIQLYLESTDRIPETIEDAYRNNQNVHNMPTAADGQMAYRYEMTDNGFNLCARFAADAPEREYSNRSNMRMENWPVIVNGEDWQYEAGEWCFEREVRF